MSTAPYYANWMGHMICPAIGCSSRVLALGEEIVHEVGQHEATLHQYAHAGGLHVW
ncbi:MAG: hypothetical protein R3E89_11800 [Thiolinea sp.]